MKSVILKFSTNSAHLVSVRVYDTRAAMRSLTTRNGHVRPNNANGLCWQANKPGSDDVVAEIHLAKTHLTLDTIVHECTHAAWHRVRLMGLPVSHDEFQEYVACAAGLLADTLLAWLSKEKIEVRLNVVPTRRVITTRI